MKITPQENEPDSPLLSWHANIIQLNRRKHVLFVNDLSRLCLIIDGVKSFFSTATQTKFESKEAQVKWLNRIIHKPINYEEPIHVFKQAIARQYFVRILKEDKK
ncbi:DUF6933 domain-containing protein [Paenibacillus sp. HW567]|uniref:DUF6933 domain-containing protein n=1 Tax=Paenibacillus sp. HW567 TaxID=1034769 RepID=UPI003FA522E8